MLFVLVIATHRNINLPETPCHLNVAWVEVVCLLEIGERSVPAILVPINPALDHKRFRIIRQLLASDRQLVTCTVVITSVEVIASQLEMSLPEVRAGPQRRVRGFLR